MVVTPGVYWIVLEWQGRDVASFFNLCVSAQSRIRVYFFSTLCVCVCVCVCVCALAAKGGGALSLEQRKRARVLVVVVSWLRCQRRVLLEDASCNMCLEAGVEPWCSCDSEDAGGRLAAAAAACWTTLMVSHVMNHLYMLLLAIGRGSEVEAAVKRLSLFCFLRKRLAHV